MERNDALQKALGLMDPDGLLRTNHRDRTRIERMVLGWIDTYGTENALMMSQRSHRYLKAWKTVRDKRHKGEGDPTP
jgi:hypothetical protein